MKQKEENRKKEVRDVLDQQVKMRQVLREKSIKEKEDFDKRILEQARKELEVERKQKQNMQ